MCFTQKERKGRKGKDAIKVTCVFSLTKAFTHANPVIDQENAESQGKRVLIFITFAQCQERYARNQNVWYRSPQTTGHVCLHKFIRFGKAMCSAMNKQVLNSTGTQTIIMTNKTKQNKTGRDQHAYVHGRTGDAYTNAPTLPRPRKRRLFWLTCTTRKIVLCFLNSYLQSACSTGIYVDL